MSNEKSQLSSELNQLQDRHVLLESNHQVLMASKGEEPEARSCLDLDLRKALRQLK